MVLRAVAVLANITLCTDALAAKRTSHRSATTSTTDLRMSIAGFTSAMLRAKLRLVGIDYRWLPETDKSIRHRPATQEGDRAASSCLPNVPPLQWLVGAWNASSTTGCGAFHAPYVWLQRFSSSFLVSPSAIWPAAGRRGSRASWHCRCIGGWPFRFRRRPRRCGRGCSVRRRSKDRRA